MSDDAMKKAVPPKLLEPVSIPGVNFDDPASLEAWYGNFGFFDHYRKVVLSNCEEIERAKGAISGEKLTETRITALARLHPNYRGFLEEHLQGRELRERNVLASFGR